MSVLVTYGKLDFCSALIVTEVPCLRRSKFDRRSLDTPARGFAHAADLFSNRFALLVHARRIGMSAVDRLAPARKFFIKEAAGETGTLPTLLQI